MLKDSKFRFILFCTIPYIFFILILFFLSFKSYAYTIDDTLPIYVDNSEFTAKNSVQSLIYNRLGTNSFWSLDREGVIVLQTTTNGGMYECYFPTNTSNPYTYIYTTPTESNYDTFNPLTSNCQIRIYQTTNTNTNNAFYKVGIRISDNYFFTYTVNNYVTLQFCGSTNATIKYLSTFIPINTNGVNSANKYLATSSGRPIILPDGENPSVFDDSGLNLDSSLNASTLPSIPNGFSYTIPTAPSWDSSQPVQSVFDYLIWGFACLNALLQGFIDLVSDWFTYLKGILVYLIQKILDYIKAVVEWLYNQFLLWLTPYLKLLNFISKILFNEDEQLSIWDIIFQLLNYFIDWTHDFFTTFWSNSFISTYWNSFYNYLVSSYSEISSDFLAVRGFFGFLYNHGLNNNNEFDLLVLINYLFIPEPYEVVNLFYNHDPFHFVSIITDVRSFIDTFISSFDEVEETYVVTLDSFTIAGVEMDSIDIDFSWYIPFQQAGDVVISGFLVFGYFMFIFFRLPYYLRGQAGNVSGSIMEAQK